MPIRMFYVPFFSIAWFIGVLNLIPFYKEVRIFAGYWLYFVLGFSFGFLANLSEIVAFLVLDSLLILKPIFFALMGIFLILGFYKLGKDLEAF